MTAQVAVLNKSAVALAADSAMTLAGSGKVYPVQKLFALTKNHPVGVMVYNNAEFMGIPWETLIKMYRQSRGIEPRPTIRAYVKDFLKFIAQKRFTTPHQETLNLLRIAADVYRDIAHMAVAEDCSIETAIRDYSQNFRRMRRSRSMTDVDVEAVLAQHRDELMECIAHVVLDFDMDPPTVDRTAFEPIHELVKSSGQSSSHSGVVIAGFGSKEIFPALIEVSVDGIVAGRVKYDRGRLVDIARDANPASVIPFAQEEMVARFMEGIDPTLQGHIWNAMVEASIVIAQDMLSSLGIERTESTEAAIRQAAQDYASSHLEEVDQFRHSEFVSPVMEVVQHLPKEELAELAEALVSLTALKRRVSLDEETVGGPIDVAVISKGDGLVWTRRKQYFDPALNPSYSTDHG